MFCNQVCSAMQFRGVGRGGYYYYYYDCTGQAAAADRALIYNKSLINYGTHN